MRKVSHSLPRDPVQVPRSEVQWPHATCCPRSARDAGDRAEPVLPRCAGLAGCSPRRRSGRAAGAASGSTCAGQGGVLGHDRWEGGSHASQRRDEVLIRAHRGCGQTRPARAPGAGTGTGVAWRALRWPVPALGRSRGRSLRGPHELSAADRTRAQAARHTPTFCSRERRSSSDLLCIWLTRLSVTPNTEPISARVSRS